MPVKRTNAKDGGAAGRTDASAKSTLALDRALFGLQVNFGNNHLFKSLNDSRRTTFEVRVNFANVVGRTDAEEAMRIMDRPLRETCRPEFLVDLNTILDRAEFFCGLAVESLSLGAAKPLDDVFSPGTERESVEIRLKLGEAQSVVTGLRVSLKMVSCSMDSEVERMRFLAQWCGTTINRLRAVVAQRATATAGPAPAAMNGSAGDDEGMFTVSDLARRFGVDQETLRKRLDRWRGKNQGSADWAQDSDAQSREARYLYRCRAVRPIIDDLRASDETTGERPTKK